MWLNKMVHHSFSLYPHRSSLACTVSPGWRTQSYIRIHHTSHRVPFSIHHSILYLLISSHTVYKLLSGSFHRLSKTQSLCRSSAYSWAPCTPFSSTTRVLSSRGGCMWAASDGLAGSDKQVRQFCLLSQGSSFRSLERGPCSLCALISLIDNRLDVY